MLQPHRQTGVVILLVTIVLTVATVPSECRALSTTEVVLTNGIKSTHLDGSFEVLEDPEGLWSFEEISQSPVANRFIRHPDTVPGFGPGRLAVWIRTRVTNSSHRTGWLLATRWSIINHIDLYQLKPDRSIRHQRGGLAVPRSSKASGNHFHTFLMNIPPGETHTVFIRMQTPAMLAVDLSIWAPDEFANYQSLDILHIGLHYGIIIALILFSLLFFFATHNRIYLYLSAVLMSYGFYFGGLEGITAEYLWPDCPWWALHSTMLACGLTFASGLMFVREYLDLHHRIPILSQIFLITALVSMAVGVWGLADYLVASNIFTVAALFGIPGVIATAILCWYRGFPVARTFLIAWGIFLVGGTWFALTVASLIPVTLLGVRSLHLGVEIGAIFLWFGVGQQIAHLGREYEARLEHIVSEQSDRLQTNLTTLKSEITGRKTIEQRLWDTLSELERSNEELEQFAYVASHDLQEPLRTMEGYVQLLRSRYGDALSLNNQQRLARINTQAQLLQQLVDGLLAYSRISTRGQPFRPADISVLVDRITADLEPALVVAQAELIIDPMPVIVADAQQLTLLFRHILTNAVQARGERHMIISIQAEKHEHYWQFRIEDTGRGIPPEARDNVFDVFSRLPDAMPGTGTGIGLAICKRIVERHGGQIHAEDNPVGGTVVVFTLPFREDWERNQHTDTDEVLT